MARIESLAKLRSLSDEEIEHLFDRDAEWVEVGLSFLRDELHRRAQSRQTRTIVRLTKWIAGMTLVVTIATVLNVILFVWG